MRSNAHVVEQSLVQKTVGQIPRILNTEESVSEPTDLTKPQLRPFYLNHQAKGLVGLDELSVNIVVELQAKRTDDENRIKEEKGKERRSTPS